MAFAPMRGSVIARSPRRRSNERVYPRADVEPLAPPADQFPADLAGFPTLADRAVDDQTIPGKQDRYRSERRRPLILPIRAPRPVRRVATKVPAMPSAVVRRNPTGLLGPGAMRRAIGSTIKPRMLGQSSGAKKLLLVSHWADDSRLLTVPLMQPLTVVGVRRSFHRILDLFERTDFDLPNPFAGNTEL